MKQVNTRTKPNGKVEITCTLNRHRNMRLDIIDDNLCIVVEIIISIDNETEQEYSLPFFKTDPESPFDNHFGWGEPLIPLFDGLREQTKDEEFVENAIKKIKSEAKGMAESYFEYYADARPTSKYGVYPQPFSLFTICQADT